MARTKQIQVDIPEYLTIKDYQALQKYKNIDTKFEKLVKVVSTFTNLTYEKIRDLPPGAITEIYEDINKLSDHEDTFYAICEFKGKVLGYQDIKASSLGSYIDLENLTKEGLDENLHKIAALLYRPITKNTLGGYKWTVKNAIKLANNSVENVFDYYTIEEYNSDKRKEVEKDFLDFPVHILLGALGFFLGSASMYLANIAFSQDKSISKQMIQTTEKKILQDLSLSIGDGLQLFTNSQKQMYFKLPETSQSQS